MKCESIFCKHLKPSSCLLFSDHVIYGCPCVCSACCTKLRLSSYQNSRLFLPPPILPHPSMAPRPISTKPDILATSRYTFLWPEVRVTVSGLRQRLLYLGTWYLVITCSWRLLITELQRNVGDSKTLVTTINITETDGTAVWCRGTLTTTWGVTHCYIASSCYCTARWTDMF